ncbi:MAG: glycosyltransferase [Bacilli bacterium]
MISVMFAGNTKVFDGMIITLLSMTKHTSKPINAYCLTMDLREVDDKYLPINENQVKVLSDILKSKNEKSNLILIDLTKIFKQEMDMSVNMRTQFTPYSMLRLFADKLEMLPDKLIYLDTDTVINDDISKLYDIDVEDYEIAAVTDIYNWTSPSRWFKKFYFNSGVLLLNMKKIKETGMFSVARKICIKRKMLYADQDALNCACKKVKQLPVIFNSKDKYYKDIVVHHFCNVREGKIKFIGKWWHRLKPWDVELVKKQMNAYDDIFEKYLLIKNKYIKDFT